MYSKIIQLKASPMSTREHITVMDLTEDKCLHAHSDWFGTPYEYDDIVYEIARELQPIAFLNKHRRTITFKKETTVSRLILKNLLVVYRNTRKELRGGVCTHTGIVTDIETAGVSSFLFHYGIGDEPAECHTLSETLIDYMNGRLPRSLRIGAILDYHS